MKKENIGDTRSGYKKTLGGLKVLEWAQFVAGPYCSKLLADFGAEVIKVEPPGVGDVARRQGDFPGDVPHPERSALFLYLNTNKKGITLNLGGKTGREVFKQLVQKVDILIEDNPPGVVRELGLNYESLEAINPHLIMVSITPFGQAGAYRDYKAYYLNTFHGGGFGYVTPLDIYDAQILEREPIVMGGLFGEYQCGLSAAAVTLAALYFRFVAHAGQHIDVSKQETLLNSQRVEVAEFLEDGQILNRAGVNVPLTANWGGIMPCRDGYVYMTGGGRQVQGLFDLLGNPEWSKDEKFKPDTFRAHQMEVRPHVLAWAAEHDREEIWHGGQRRGITMAAVYNVGETLGADHLKAREFFVEIEHPEAGKLPYPSGFCQMSGTPLRLERSAPLLGGHNQEVYCDWLGYSQQDLMRLRGMGVI